jgi:hypothetical protein
MDNQAPFSKGEGLAFRPSTITYSILALALASFSAFAQTTNPPARPSDWEQPSGPYAVVMEEDPGIPDHTVYRPANLAAMPKQERMPIVAFDGPGCDANGTAFRPFFTEVASHGYLLIAGGLPEPKGGSGADFPKTKPEDLTASIDWAIAENSRKDGKYFQRLDTSKIAVMGQSCGGAQALAISKDPRIDTIVMWNSCSFQFMRGGGPPPAGGASAGRAVEGGMPAGRGTPAGRGMPAGRGGGIPVPNVDKELVTTLRVPIAYFMGGQRDMLYQASRADIDMYEAAPLFWASTDLPGDAHAGSFREKNGGKFGVAGVAWLKWQLKGDRDAAKMFVGAACGLCTDPNWEVKKKRID